MNRHEKIVDFARYCKLCDHWALKDFEEPCNDCLDNPTNLESKRPIHFKENYSDTSKKKTKNTKGEN